jgi:hypothetical protein
MSNVPEFLHKDNSAGQTLLSLVGRGSAIVAELLRLSDHIPSVFRGSPNDPAERAKYASILFDFKYLKAAELVDAKIESDSVSCCLRCAALRPRVADRLCLCCLRICSIWTKSFAKRTWRC